MKLQSFSPRFNADFMWKREDVSPEDLKGLQKQVNSIRPYYNKVQAKINLEENATNLVLHVLPTLPSGISRLYAEIFEMVSGFGRAITFVPDIPKTDREKKTLVKTFVGKFKETLATLKQRQGDGGEFFKKAVCPKIFLGLTHYGETIILQVKKQAQLGIAVEVIREMVKQKQLKVFRDSNYQDAIHMFEGFVVEASLDPQSRDYQRLSRAFAERT